MAFLTKQKDKIKKLFRSTSNPKQQLKTEAETNYTDRYYEKKALLGNGDLHISDTEDHLRVFERVTTKNSSVVGISNFECEHDHPEPKKPKHEKHVTFGEAKVHDPKKDICDRLKEFSRGLHLREETGAGRQTEAEAVLCGEVAFLSLI